ncbi:MAG: ABC transporter permease subunit [Kofleriaceae bacterium]
MRHVLKLTRWELWKLARRPSSYVGFVLCLVFIIVTLIGFEWSQWKGKRIGGLGLDPSVYLNGPFFANFVLNIGFFALLPLVAATVAGNQLAGESKDGTLRALLMRPPSRTAVYAAKALASLVWLELMVLFLCGLALVVGHVAYGGGSLLVYIWEFRSDGFWLVGRGDWPALLALACLGAGASLAVVVAAALCVSAMTDNPVVAHVGTLGAFFISSVLQRLPDEIMGPAFKDILPTSHMNFWHELYRWYHPAGSTVDHARFWSDASWSAGLTVGLLALGLLAFRRRDVTT